VDTTDTQLTAAEELTDNPEAESQPPTEQIKAEVPKAQSPAAPTRSKAGQKPTLRTGQRVILQNLRTEELNGHRGIVVKWKEDAGRYAVRIAGKEMAIKPENLKPEGGVAEAIKFQRKYANTEGTMYNPVVYLRTPGSGPKMTQWIGQVKAGRRIVVRAEMSPELDEVPIPLWYGDRGFVGSKPVDIALLITDVGANVDEWPKAISRVLDRFPPAAGRLRQLNKRGPEQEWQIVQNNAGVPFTTATVPPCGLPRAEDLQLACGDEQCGFFDLGVANEDTKIDEPLLRLKLVYEEGTAKGVLGVSFHHALCDISGIGAVLRWLHSELDATAKAPEQVPTFGRAEAQEVFEAVPEATSEEEATYTEHWPLFAPAFERWCFLARRLRSGLRGRPDGVASVFLTVPAKTVDELKAEAVIGGEATASAFDVLVTYMGMKLLRLGRLGRRTLVTKDYRAALHAAAPDRGMDQLFANVVTHGISFEMPDANEAVEMPLGEACRAMRKAIDVVNLGYVRWHSKQDHFRGLPNMFGGLCCNTWGRSLVDVGFIESYAVGFRSVDERAANMVFPLDTAYLQIFPQPSGSHTMLLTAPITEITSLLKELPSSHFELPHVSQMRTHAFRVPLPGKVVDELNPTVETHHMEARIACIGDSMTASTVDSYGAAHGYPDFLKDMFEKAGIKAKVRNFGAPSSTAQRFSDYPYWDERKLEAARLWRPHFVIATFGHNDAKSSNWDAAAFEKDYADLCHEFLERMSPRPGIFLVAPPPLYEDDKYDMQQEVINKELQTCVIKAAHAAERKINAPLEDIAKRSRKPVPEEMVAHTAVIDAFSFLGGAELRRRSCFAEDGVHLNERGTKMLAFTIFADLRRDVTRCLRKWADAPSSLGGDPMDML